MAEKLETYLIKIERNGGDFNVAEHYFPEDDVGKKMLAILLYQIAYNLDPANKEKLQ